MSKKFMQKSLQEIIDQIKTKKENNPQSFEPYIQSIRFPHYKLLEKDTKINFVFPFTVLIGENGCNKTSVLQALYGTPANKSVGEYWFETNIDKIDGNARNCLIYEYYQQKLGKNVEALKTRIQKDGNPDYWEPSKPVKAYGMISPSKEELERAGNKAKTRWDQLDKNVVYSDCKEYVSAYDLFFYHYNFENSKKFKSRQDFIRSRSKHLSEVIKRGETNYRWYGKDQIKSNESLSDEICEIVSQIMGEKYSEIRIITHSLYSKGTGNKPSKTIWLKKNDRSYSEAFAGTGESRLVLLINDVMSAPNNSLILIDEPEISLHPRAINNLKKFLLNECLTKGHQIVITSHSSQIIKGLPSCAIKYMKETGTGEINVTDSTEFGEAFFELEDVIERPIRLVVEDKLSELLVNEVIKRTESRFYTEKIRVDVIPGGAESIIKNYVTASAIMGKESEYYLLDGDKKHEILEEYKGILAENEFYEEEVKNGNNNEKYYGKMINNLIGFELKISTSSNPGKEILDLQKLFLKFYMSHVYFMPCKTPELGILGALGEKIYTENGKKEFVEYTKKDIGSASSEEIFFTQKRLLHQIESGSEIFNKIGTVLKRIK